MTVTKKERNFRSRYQTKFKRAHTTKTNYKNRRKLLTPNYKTYGQTKLRLVVRKTNTQIICQVTKAYLTGDKVIVSANSAELKAFGVKFGLTNYSAAYLTGLLLSKRFMLSEMKGPVFMDIGLNRSTKGARVYASMKGAVDGGMNIPHGEKVFPGYVKGEDFNDSTLRERILGSDVISYMKIMKEEDEEKYKKHFSVYLKNEVNENNLRSIYEKAINDIENIKEITKKEAKDYSGLKKFKVQKTKSEVKKENLAKKLQAIGLKN